MAAGEIPGDKVFETEDVVAFHDLTPQAPTHVLVIPKRHIESVGAAAAEDGALLGEVLLGCRRVAEELNVTRGYRIVLNTGVDAGQTVTHLHAHVLAGRGMAWPPG
ncbi:MAG: histidine triad nucleotide-binding protein [Armatimonadetes bacterium]|nr:histidine triad nucleotide-binding protein [Armatimonadota bacterium]